MTYLKLHLHGSGSKSAYDLDFAADPDLHYESAIESIGAIL